MSEPKASISRLSSPAAWKIVTAHHPFGHREIAGDEALNRCPHPFLGQASHFQQSRLEGPEFLLEMSYGTIHQPNLPVT